MLKQACDGGAGLSSVVNKRDIESRDISITCCLDNMCNFPGHVNPLPVFTTAMPVTAAPTVDSIYLHFLIY